MFLPLNRHLIKRPRHVEQMHYSIVCLFLVLFKRRRLSRLCGKRSVVLHHKRAVPQQQMQGHVLQLPVCIMITPLALT
jgi:hypothetical protein